MSSITDVLTSAEVVLFFGIASGVLSTFAYIPYIRDTIARRTQPQRASWLIWSVLGSIAFVSQVFEGATSSLWFAGVQITGTVIVFVLSIWVGKGRYLSKSDYLILAAAAVGLVLWYLTDNAAYALAITISISLLGGMATAIKAYHDPDSETLITWVVSFIASACAILSVGVVDFTLLAYPFYLFTLYLAFIVAIVTGRARKKSAQQTTTASAPQLSLKWLTAGLRTTADAVIVGAAGFLMFGWLGTLLSANDASAVANRSIDEVTVNAGTSLANTRRQALQSADSLPLPAPVTTRYIDPRDHPPAVIPTPVSTATAIVNSRDSNDMHLPATPSLLPQGSPPRILVVAIGWPDASGMNHKPLLLHDADPLAIYAKAQLKDWYKETIGPLSSSYEVQAAASPQADHQVSSSVLSELSLQAITKEIASARPAQQTTTTAAGPTGQAQSYSQSTAQDFLLLDEGDPFAMLTVNSDTLLHAKYADSGLYPVQLPSGTRVKALATNGEWFRVQVDGTLEGYIHHSAVLIDLFSSLPSHKSS